MDREQSTPSELNTKKRVKIPKELKKIINDTKKFSMNNIEVPTLMYTAE
jgi:hypothetical protein